MDYDALEQKVLALERRIQWLEMQGVRPPEGAITQTIHHPVLLPPPQKSSPSRNK